MSATSRSISQPFPTRTLPVTLAEGKAAEDVKQVGETKEDILSEASVLLGICPFQNDEQRLKFEEVTAPLPGLPKGKPSPGQIAALKQQRQRRDLFFAEVSDEVEQILRRVLELRKKASNGQNF